MFPLIDPETHWCSLLNLLHNPGVVVVNFLPFGESLSENETNPKEIEGINIKK